MPEDVEPRTSVARSVPPPPPSPESELVLALSDLGDAALAAGEHDVAESRYRRALSVDPQSRRARIGLISVFIASQREQEASDMLVQVLEIATGAQRVDALILLAGVEAGQGRSEQARLALRAALALDDDRYNAHQQLADLSGKAPRGAPRDADEALRRALRHPYDAAALVAGARVRAERGDAKGAVKWLEDALWLADVDYESSRTAYRLLVQLDPGWKGRSVVDVHVYADESVRREAGWPARMRMVWRSVSASLDLVLRTAFVPITIDRFRARSDPELASILQAFHDSVPRRPSYGLIAVMTDRAPARRRGSHQLGVAEFLGRELAVRLTPGKITSRTLIHEVLHIYGGVHVAPGIEALMNPSGRSVNIDVVNQTIAELVRNRRFGPGGLHANILPYTDVESLASAYTDSLRLNLGLRRKGVKQARAETSRYVGAEIGRKALEMDPHLGDVARMTGSLAAELGHFAEAASLFEVAGRLYGPRTARAHEMSERATAMREAAALMR